MRNSQNSTDSLDNWHRVSSLVEEKTMLPNFDFRNILLDMMKSVKFSIENYILEPDRSG